MACQMIVFVDAGYQGDCIANCNLVRQGIFFEYVIRKIKSFRTLSERYRNQRKCFGLRFDLNASHYNLEHTDFYKRFIKLNR